MAKIVVKKRKRVRKDGKSKGTRVRKKNVKVKAS